MDDRICIPSPAAIRHQLGIEDADPRVFRANGLDEAIAVAREIWWDEMIAPEIRRHLIVGLTLEQAIACPALGAPLVVLGAPLTIDADAFRTADGDLEASLRRICAAVHAQGSEPVR